MQGEARKSPYRGLEPFDEQDAAYFFGREREARLITASLFASPLTLLYGASGVGKSSVLRAGVLPQLRERSDVLPVVFPAIASERQAAGSVVTRGWQSEPVEGIKATAADALFAAAGEDQATLGRWRDAVRQQETASLREFLSFCHEVSGRRLMVILDQFEEYFLYHPAKDAFTEQFARAIVPGDLSVSFLVSLREDALAKLDRFKGRISTLWDRYRRIDHLDREAAKVAILGPIDQFNRLEVPGMGPIAVDPELVTAVLEQVRTGSVDVGPVGQGVLPPGSDPGRIETPYLQLVMTRLWDTEMRALSEPRTAVPPPDSTSSAPKTPVLRLQTLRDLGGAARIVRTHLDSALESLKPDEQDIASRVFRYLVTPSGTKIAHTINDLADYAEVPAPKLTQVLEALCQGTVRILRPVAPPPGQLEGSRYEIFHDVLAPAILDWRARHAQAQISLQSRLDTVDYIVVGSGAGGGPLAANLAEAGYSVLLLEAGGDPLTLGHPRLPEDYNVPAFHPFASENEGMRWDFFVRRPGNEQQQMRDPKLVAERGGVLYPRAGVLGGCTAIGAMILVCPDNADWDHIASLTGDPSWKAETMRRYFERMENCKYRIASARWFRRFNRARHGYDGWLSTETATPAVPLLPAIIRAAQVSARDFGEPRSWFKGLAADPNDWQILRAASGGVRYLPLTTRGHARSASRERILNVARSHRLRIELNALVTRVLFDEENRAIGVEYLKGERLYRAHANPRLDPEEKRQAFASRETILCGGAFNTPQLLMLSGIGPREDLERYGIAVRVDLPGVGKNLQDNREISVVSRLTQDVDILEGAKFAKDDPLYMEWALKRTGYYTTNGGMLGVAMKSEPRLAVPDLFCLAMLGKLEGYFPGHSKGVNRHNYLTWIVLKARTSSMAGEVKLRSADPRDTPRIELRDFDAGTDSPGADLKAVVTGVKYVRALNARLQREGFIAEEELPGSKVQTDAELGDFVKDQSWGRHASCTCRIGSNDDPMAVVDGGFTVRGTRNLRVVDASVFPRTPGFFIMAAVQMVAEKASDVILADARKKPELKNKDVGWSRLRATAPGKEASAKL